MPRNTLLAVVLLMLRSARSFIVGPCSAVYRKMRITAAANSSTSTNPVAGASIAQAAEEEMGKLINYNMSNIRGAPLLLETREQSSEFIKDIDTILFDCDGVLYRSPTAIQGSRECLLALQQQGKQLFFVTNNAANSRLQLCEKLHAMLDIDTLSGEMMISSSYACAEFLRQNKVGERLFVIGSDGLRDELRVAGYTAIGINNNSHTSMTREELAHYDLPTDIDAVVVGHDTDFNFCKMSVAVNLLRHPTTLLVATNMDAFDLVGSDARHIPGNGALVRSIEYASKKTAINVGKPSKTLVELMSNKYGIDPSRSLIVGDRLDTDILFGVASGMKSLLVLTGVTTPEKLKSIGMGTSEEPLPSAVIAHVGLLAG